MQYLAALPLPSTLTRSFLAEQPAKRQTSSSSSGRGALDLVARRERVRQSSSEARAKDSGGRPFDAKPVVAF
jgi:hypothetical protein